MKYEFEVMFSMSKPTHANAGDSIQVNNYMKKYQGIYIEMFYKAFEKLAKEFKSNPTETKDIKMILTVEEV